jgi:hypothetical protein
VHEFLRPRLAGAVEGVRILRVGRVDRRDRRCEGRAEGGLRICTSHGFTLSGKDRFVERLHELDASGRSRIVVFGEESRPAWKKGALRTAVSIPARRRYAEISELLFDLRHPNSGFLGEAPLPLIERDPLRFWKGLAALLAAGWVTTLWFWLSH